MDNTTCIRKDLTKLSIKELKSKAKSKGLRGYSNLCKAELIDLLIQRSIDLRRQRNRDLLRQRQIDLLKQGKKPRVNLRLEQPNLSVGSLLDAPIPLDEIPNEDKSKGILKPTKAKAKAIEKAVEMGKKEVENWGEWLKEMDAFENTRPLVDDAIEAFKSHIAGLYEKRLYEMRLSALKCYSRQFKIRGIEGYGPKSFLLTVKPSILKFLRENPNTKIKLVLKCRMSKTDLKTGEVIYTDAFFTSKVEINFQGTDVVDLYSRMLQKMLESLAKYQQKGSNWVFDKVEELHFYTVKYEPLSGSSYIPLPEKLKNKKAIINMKNKDNECFKWCVTRALNPVEKHAVRISEILQLQAKKLNWKGLKFPVELSQISRFEKLNNISVNVYGYEKDVVYPLSVSNSENAIHVNLLLISQGEKKHYCLIKSMSRLLTRQITKKKAKKFFCPRCLNSFGRQDLLDKHLELCQDSEAVRINMPEEGTFMYFKNYFKKMDMPIVIYADFESLMKAILSSQPNPKKSYTEKKTHHKPI